MLLTGYSIIIGIGFHGEGVMEEILIIVGGIWFIGSLVQLAILRSRALSAA
jgi:hypothetical protein